MQISIFGIIWILLLLYSLSNNKYMGYLVLASFVFQSAWVFIIGSVDFNCSLVTCTIFVMKNIIKKRKIKIPKWGKIAFVYAIFTLIISVVSPLVFDGLKITSMTNDGYDFNYTTETVLHFSFSNLTQPLSILLYVITAIVIYNCKDSFSWESFEKFFRMLFLLVFIVGVIHVIFMFFGLPLGILKNLFHNEKEIIGGTYFDYYLTGRFARFMSTFYEPSYCGGYLSMCLMFFIFSKKKDNVKYIILTLIALALNLSSTGLAGASIVMFSYLIIKLKEGKIEKKMFTLFVIIVIVGGIVIMSNTTIRQVFYSMTFGKTSSGSAILRGINNRYCLEVFKNTYGFGTGLNSVTAYSLVYALLSQIGIVGSLLYVIFLKNVYNFVSMIHTKNERMQIIYLIAGALIASVLSCSALNLCIFWFSICVFAMAHSLQHNNNQNMKMEK